MIIQSLFAIFANVAAVLSVFWTTPIEGQEVHHISTLSVLDSASPSSVPQTETTIIVIKCNRISSLPFAHRLC